MLSRYHCALIASLFLPAGTSVADSPPLYTCDLPTLIAPPDPVPACQTPCDPFGTPACGPCTSGSTCTVTTMLELSRALYCRANSGQCTHIIIPSTATIPFCNQIYIGSVYINNAPVGLTLTIDGTLLWVGPEVPNDAGGSTPTLIRVDNIAGTAVTINGSGMIRSIREPCQDPDDDVCLVPNSSARIHIGNGIKITNSNNVTVQGTSTSAPLKFQRLSTAVLVEGFNSNGLAFRNLDIKGMTQYGIFVGATSADEKISGVTIEDCHVQGAYDQHGFRVYASEVAIRRCTSCQERASGVWVVQGKNILIDDFETDHYVRIGPNHECDGGGGPEKGERLINAEITNINANHIEVQSGVIGCWLHGLALHSTNDDLSIGRGPGGNSVARPNNRIHWNVASGTQVQIYGSTNSGGNPTGVNGTDISPCRGDVDDGGTVDVSDLLA